MCVCVFWPPVSGGGPVKHAIPIASLLPRRHPLHTLGLIVLTPPVPQGGLQEEVFQEDRVSWFWDSVAAAIVAVPQPSQPCPRHYLRTLSTVG